VSKEVYRRRDTVVQVKKLFFLLRNYIEGILEYFDWNGSNFKKQGADEKMENYICICKHMKNAYAIERTIVNATRFSIVIGEWGNIGNNKWIHFVFY